MPGCNFEVCGKDFDPDAFLKTSSFEPYDIWRRGESKSLIGHRSKTSFDTSGFGVEVSDACGDLRAQLVDAEAFLMRSHDELSKLTALPTVDESRLHFGFHCRLSDKIWKQGEYLPISFLRLVGNLGVAVALSLYPARQYSDVD